MATDPKCECMLPFSVLDKLSHEAHVAFHTGDRKRQELAWLELVWAQMLADGQVAA